MAERNPQQRSPREQEFLRQAREKLAGDFGSRAIKYTDDHHTLFERRSWHYRPEAASLRENPSLIAHKLARTAHNLLHAETAPVPVPGYHTLLRVNNRMPRDLDVLDGIDTFCSLIEQSNQHPRIKPIEVKVNELCIESLRMQIPFIKDGLGNKRRIIT